MTQLIAASKRFAVIFYTAIALVSTSPVGTFFATWLGCWQANSAKILTLTAVNTALTAGTEYASRSILSNSIQKDKSYGFIVSDAGPWWQNINRHSLINIWMTFFASLIGAPVYFFKKRISRFVFFICFGVFNSGLSQGILSLLKDSVLLISAKRLLFDFIYTGTIKYGMFEFYRKPIKNKSGFLKLGFIRGKQDLLTSLFKNAVLNFLKFRG